ncbi:tyrosine-type recombinase/integrase [Neptuniibacter sp. PT8_73]|uniref:tyrosine-type recombinase/integrase n=1 Tax=Neptuniibacter sp. PT8_73 TaxID=3398206 RepID=UPI0039F48935
MQTTKSAPKPLSPRAIEVMKPGDKVKADTAENSGLRIKCGRSGTKTFFYRYTSPVTGKLVQIKIGNYPAVSLAQARVTLQELKVLRKSGKCPATEAKEERAQQLEAEAEQRKITETQSFTVHVMVELYLRHYIEDRVVDGKRIEGARKRKGQREVRRTLEGDAVRVLGDLPAYEITRKDVVALIMGIVDRGANVQAGNVLREFTAAYEFAIGLEKFPDDFANPALLAKSSLRQAKVKLTSQKGKRILTDKELKQFLQWLPGSAFTPTQKNILKFTLWTGCRTGEICDARWDDIDLEKGYWHLRTAKNEAERFVQLPQQALDYLKQLKNITGEYPFPSQKTGKPIQQKSLTEQAWHLRQSDRMLAIDHWTPHDLRRTVRTGLARLGCPSEVAEAVLGHSRKGIEGTYDLHKYEKESRLWLQKWSDHMDGLLV